MKKHFSRVVALGVLICASLPSQAQFGLRGELDEQILQELPDSNATALGYIGSFFHKMQRASSFRGHMSINRSNTRMGITKKTNLEVQSTWISDVRKSGFFKKRSETLAITSTVPDKIWHSTTHYLGDGFKNYEFDEEKNFWMAEPSNDHGSTFLFQLTYRAWDEALTQIAFGEKFKVERKVVGNLEQVIIIGGREETSLGKHEYLFDAKTGDLQRLIHTYKGGVSESVWSLMEFNVPLADSLFKWQTPRGAKQFIPVETGGGVSAAR